MAKILRAIALGSFLEKNNTNRLVMFFFFQKKKQKALFRFAEAPIYSPYIRNGTARVYVLSSSSREPRRANAFGSFLEKNDTNRLVMFFFFKKKKQKALFRFAEAIIY
jgi:hypothetical protein